MSSASVSRPLAPATGLHHVRLTVTDIDRAKSFYAVLLGSDPAADFSSESDPAARDDPARLYGGCVFALGDQLLGLRPVAAADDRFDSVRVGLDHLSLAVSSMDELRASSERLDEAGVRHGEITPLDDMGIAIMSIQDPDDINLELTAPLG